MWPLPDMTHGQNSNNGVTKRVSGWCCLRPKGAGSYLDFRYERDDVLLFGRESAGVTDEVASVADARLVIPIRPGLRSLNVAMAAAMALGEALRQTGPAIQGETRPEER